MSNPVEIRPGIWWVGVIDRESLNIHGQITGGGTTYNAYLILDEHPTLIDTVKAPFADELIENITKVIDPLKIDYVVSNHGEPDHSGSIPAVCKACKNATLYSTAKKGLKFLEGEYHEGLSLPTVGVKTGDTLELGKHTLTFVETPMVHWPDNMVTYCADEKILFSNDAFGQHYATDERYDDEVPFDMLMRQVEIYYANIVEPFNRQVKATLAKVAGLDIDLIAPAHGVMWRSHIADIVAKYDDLANDRHGNDAVICYDSMWDSTEKMAAAIAAGFESAGIATQIARVDVV